jgi:hypothetical protein
VGGRQHRPRRRRRARRDPLLRPLPVVATACGELGRSADRRRFVTCSACLDALPRHPRSRGAAVRSGSRRATADLCLERAGNLFRSLTQSLAAWRIIRSRSPDRTPPAPTPACEARASSESGAPTAGGAARAAPALTRGQRGRRQTSTSETRSSCSAAGAACSRRSPPGVLTSAIAVGRARPGRRRRGPGTGSRP